MLVNERPQERVNPEFDNEASLAEAKKVHPFQKVLEGYGHGPRNGGNWRSFECPFCHNKTAGLTERGGVDFFKCFHTDCSTGTKALPVVQYIAQVTGLSSKEAFMAYLKQAGVWKDRTKLRSGGKPDKLESFMPQIRELLTVVPAMTTRQIHEALVAKGFDGSWERLRKRLAQLGAAAEPTEPKVDAPAAPTPPPAAPDPLRSLKKFYSMLTLTAEDALMLIHKRGSDKTIREVLAYKSNRKSNLSLLEALAKEFPVLELEKVGLWKNGEPNRQFYGYGRTNQKIKDADGEDAWIWDWIRPILIPYFDDDGSLISLRPHKGMSTKETLLGVSRIYVPNNGPGQKFEHAIITEGEFKAGILWRWYGGGATGLERSDTSGVVGLPGISFARNYAVRQELERWLRIIGAGEVLVAYDNETKSNPALPSYKADPRKRHDSLIWASYLAQDLHRELGLRTKVLILPEEWKDPTTGKADWDGRAAQLYKQNPAPIGCEADWNWTTGTEI